MNARQLQSLGNIDAHDARMAAGAGEELAGQHPRQPEVGHIFGAAGDFLLGVNPGMALAYNVTNGHYFLSSIANACVRCWSPVCHGHNHGPAKQLETGV